MEDKEFILNAKRARQVHALFLKEKIEHVIADEHSYMVEVSNHLPGTEDRSALLFWTPHSWGIDSECFERLNILIEMENLNLGAIFSDGDIAYSATSPAFCVILTACPTEFFTCILSNEPVPVNEPLILVPVIIDVAIFTFS